ncbi:hypothetical protein CLU79DRAFT_835045 [Phycomyces nitens]|nr:hypothetical protein CLU79DRAFT_835045 [Phycomyces nitens]
MYKDLGTDAANVIDDKINLMVCHLSPGGEVVNLLFVEFTKDGNNDKYFMDHRKVLRETKVNVDRFFTLKVNLLSQREHFDAMEHEQVARKESMEAKQNKQKSPYENDFDDISSNSLLSSYCSLESAASNEKYTSSVRSSWLPPAIKKGRWIIGSQPSTDDLCLCFFVLASFADR